MILNTADNVMFGDIEVSKIYCGNVIVWQRGGGRVLPEGYTAINGYYMEQSPFNTNFRPTSGILRLETEITINSSGSQEIIGGFGSDPYDLRDTGSFATWISGSSGAYVFHASTFGSPHGSYIHNNCVSSTYSGNEFEINATLSSTLNSISVNGNLTELPISEAQTIEVFERDVWIGSNGDPAPLGDDEYFYGTIHYLKLYDNTTLARDFVPAVRDSDGQSGLYDFVTEEFYY